MRYKKLHIKKEPRPPAPEPEPTTADEILVLPEMTLAQRLAMVPHSKKKLVLESDIRAYLAKHEK
jgi:hypothetical protein